MIYFYIIPDHLDIFLSLNCISWINRSLTFWFYSSLSVSYPFFFAPVPFPHFPHFTPPLPTLGWLFITPCETEGTAFTQTPKPLLVLTSLDPLSEQCRYLKDAHSCCLNQVLPAMFPQWTSKRCHPFYLLLIARIRSSSSCPRPSDVFYCSAILFYRFTYYHHPHLFKFIPSLPPMLPIELCSHILSSTRISVHVLFIWVPP